MGIELHAVLEFSDMTMPKATNLVEILKQTAAEVTDAQLHGKSYSHPLFEREDKAGKIKDGRRISIFVKAKTQEAAENRLKEVYRRLNATPGYGCDIVTQYTLK